MTFFIHLHPGKDRMVLRASGCLHSTIIIGKLRRMQDGEKRTPGHKKPALTDCRDMEGPSQLSRLHIRESWGASSSEPQWLHTGTLCDNTGKQERSLPLRDARRCPG